MLGGAVDPMVVLVYIKTQFSFWIEEKRREIEGANVGNAEGGPFLFLLDHLSFAAYTPEVITLGLMIDSEKRYNPGSNAA